MIFLHQGTMTCTVLYWMKQGGQLSLIRLSPRARDCPLNCQIDDGVFLQIPTILPALSVQWQNPPLLLHSNYRPLHHAHTHYHTDQSPSSLFPLKSAKKSTPTSSPHSPQVANTPHPSTAKATHGSSIQILPPSLCSCPVKSTPISAPSGPSLTYTSKSMTAASSTAYHMPSRASVSHGKTTASFVSVPSRSWKSIIHYYGQLGMWWHILLGPVAPRSRG